MPRLAPTDDQDDVGDTFARLIGRFILGVTDVALSILMGLYVAFVGTRFWGWFVEPLTQLHSPPILHLWGILTFVAFITNARVPARGDTPEEARLKYPSLVRLFLRGQPSRCSG